jgi:hypothetical protein
LPRQRLLQSTAGACDTVPGLCKCATFIIQADAALAFAMIAEVNTEIVMLVIIVAAEMV